MRLQIDFLPAAADTLEISSPGKSARAVPRAETESLASEPLPEKKDAMAAGIFRTAGALRITSQANVSLGISIRSAPDSVQRSSTEDSDPGLAGCDSFQSAVERDKHRVVGCRKFQQICVRNLLMSQQCAESIRPAL